MDIDFPALCQLITAEFPDFWVHKGAVKIKGDPNWSRYDHRVFPYLINKKDTLLEKVAKVVGPAACLELQSNKHNQALLDGLYKHLKSKNRDQASSKAGRLHFDRETHTPLDKVKFIQNSESLANSFLYLPDTDTVLKMDWAGINYRLAKLFPDADLRNEYLEGRVHIRTLTYQPFYMPEEEMALPRDVLLSDKDFIGFNTWKPPKWFEGWEPEESHYLPDLFKDYLEHMFREPKQRQAVLAWLHDAIFSRAKSALCLQGGQGCGKGLFGTHLCKAMVREDGWDSVEERFYTNSFTAGKELAQILFVDEKGIPGEEARIKVNRFLEDSLKTEGKGENLSRYSKQLHTSLVITSNEMSKWYALPGERRFFYPDLPESGEQYPHGDEFIEMVEDVEFQRNFANYLKTNFKAGGSKSYPSTQTYRRVVEQSQPAYIQAVIDLLESGRNVTKMQAHKLASKKYGTPSLKKYLERLRAYERYMKKPVFELKEGSNEAKWTLLTVCEVSGDQ